MISEWDMLGLRLRRGRCTSAVDSLFICNARNEELTMKNEVDIATCNRQKLKNRYIRCKLLYQRFIAYVRVP